MPKLPPSRNCGIENESAISESMRSLGDQQYWGKTGFKENKYCGLTGAVIPTRVLPACTELKKDK